MNRRNHVLILGAFAAAVAVGGCGLGSSTSKTAISKAPNTPVNAKTTYANVQQQQVKQEQARFAKLPKSPANTVQVASGSSLGITPTVIQAYQKTDPGVTVDDSTTSATDAFHQVCTGRASIAETTRAPSAEELNECTQNGITFNEDSNGNPIPIELAADGIVVATKNESDVGGDCLRASTVRAIFKPGSTYDNWSQVGFDDLPLSTAGREANTDVFQLFSNIVLGTEGDATLGDVRSDYQAQGTDLGTQDLVTGAPKIAAIRKKISDGIAAQVKTQRTKIFNAQVAAQAAADKVVLRKIAAQNLALKKSKKVLTPAQKTAIARQNAALDAAARTTAAANAKATYLAAISRRVNALYAAQLEAAERPGTLGVFRFSYYELYEDKLRPMEIWDPTTSETQLTQEGVATNQTAADEKTTTTLRQQAGGGVSNVTSYSFPQTPTTAGVTFTAAGGQKVSVPRGGAVNVNTTPNCIFPSRQTITSGVYPLSVRLLAYVPKNQLKRSSVINYLSYYLLAGQSAVDNARLISLPDSVRQTEYHEVTGKQVTEAQLLRGENPAGALAGVSTAEGAVVGNTAGTEGATAGSTGTSNTSTSSTSSSSGSTSTSTVPQATFGGSSGSTPGVG